MTFLARRDGTVYWTGNTGNYAAGAKGDDSIKLARIVARGMETRRAMMAASIMKYIFRPCYEKNNQFTTEPKLSFHPKRIALDFDPNVLNFLQELRDRGDLSRDTILSELDIDQADEARKRRREKEAFDDVFEPPVTPVAPSPGGGGPTSNKTPSSNPRAAGRKGGRQGGTNRTSFNTKPPRGPAKEGTQKASDEADTDPGRSE